MKAAGTWHKANDSRWFKKLIDEGVIGFAPQKKTVWVMSAED